ncbi:NAD(P)/FAD-dependent oxidoreductase [Heyndrickxia sporothermodurans]|uniref:Thioredoxin reductase n=1 Tax=Heyndrickxia sporothermodurans TaxID=46224 RepID=A0A150L783_9BACI|nr:NAD(P)/FAD-dependent oxidoreductase [Heyndrickxia sporothermodurans]KYD07866.1 Thioredoxin reductase [Heyndrickxia sporothermodurans]MEB6549941.1 NAD(P)/FAD-dependent oxidoreductase [Heyndrickxia sporothermodurans]MED3653918.1 NAD(P)/FAD-dependent oxidoreductase [Heyndrickxia sporothermodurans]PTY78050.1 pyridine nucleotide-disulfide oxidoreductase [Heyndrickxia sporothermodurans]
MIYDCIIIGGGIAGLQAAIQLGRYQHKILVIDSHNGRSNLCRAYHNILGWANGVSGEYLRTTGRSQAEDLGVEFINQTVVTIEQENHAFVCTVKDEKKYTGNRILFATGIMDRLPNFPEIYPCLGVSVYVCPDCDGYEVKNKRTIVIGAGNVGANMALTLTYWTDNIIYINHEQTEIDAQLQNQLQLKNITYYNEAIKNVITKESQFKGVVLENNLHFESEHAFVALGGNDVRSGLAASIGIQLHENQHILTDPRTKMTNIKNVWAAGDVVAHSEQVTIAMGEGAQAAIWIHKSLL